MQTGMRVRGSILMGTSAALLAIPAVAAQATPVRAHGAGAAHLASDPTDPPTPPPAWRAAVQEYALPHPPGTTVSDLRGITMGPDGNLWVTQAGFPSGQDTGAIDKVTAAGTIAARYPVASAYGITPGPDGAMWFTGAPAGTQGYAPMISRVTTDGAVSGFTLPGYPDFANPRSIAVGPDGALWFSDFESNSVGRITTSGQVTRFAISGSNNGGIATGGDGNVWVAETNIGVVARITPGGAVSEFTIPKRTPILGGMPEDITAGPDGALWATDSGNNTIDEITTSGAFTLFPIPTTASVPMGITVGADGDLWFTEWGADRIGRLDPATGTVIEFHVPTIHSGPLGIITAVDGKLWFDEQYGPCPVDPFHCNAPNVASLDPATIQPPPGPCMTIASDTTLQHDVGPCAGDGIDVVGNNVTLNLNGHRVFSTGGLKTGDFAGVHLEGVSGVTVMSGRHGGQVTGFDAGVFIDHGSGNVVTHLDLHDNIGSQDAGNALLGDGIVAMHSSNNRIAGNSVVHNGIFDGIGLLGLHTDGNTVTGNVVKRNTDMGQGDPGGGTGIITNAFLEFENPGRGESVSGNNIVRNTVEDNDNSGISNASNTHALVEDNTVTGNGFQDMDPGNGIGDQNLFAATPAVYMRIEHNIVTGNAVDGIQVNSQFNTILDNTAPRNGGPGGVNGFDLDDLTSGPTGQGCFNNTWFGNTWGIAGWYPACVTAGGSGPNPPPPSAARAPRHVTASGVAAQWFSRGKRVPSTW